MIPHGRFEQHLQHLVVPAILSVYLIGQYLSQALASARPASCWGVILVDAALLRLRSLDMPPS